MVSNGYLLLNIAQVYLTNIIFFGWKGHHLKLELCFHPISLRNCSSNEAVTWPILLLVKISLLLSVLRGSDMKMGFSKNLKLTDSITININIFEGRGSLLNRSVGHRRMIQILFLISTVIVISCSWLILGFTFGVEILRAL